MYLSKFTYKRLKPRLVFELLFSNCFCLKIVFWEELSKCFDKVQITFGLFKLNISFEECVEKFKKIR